MERGCDNCRHMTKGVEQYPCNQCINNYGEIIDKWEQRTNADRIRAMNDEELAEFLCGVFDEDECNGKYICGITIPNYDEDKIFDWLKSPTTD